MRDNEVDIFGNLIGFHLGGEIIERKEGTRGVVLTVDRGESCYPRYIAYKTIKGSIEPEKLENFVREAKQWFKVRGHPLILTPFYIQSFGNMPLICMPYCEMDLESYLKKQEQGKMNKIASLIFGAQIIKALLFARSKGIEAHQDLTPRNILVEDLSKKFLDWPPEGVHHSIRYKIRLADFGLANAYREIDKPQGAFLCMAPEQYEPTEYKIYYPDIFATGVIMTIMLTGRHPSGRTAKGFVGHWKKEDKYKWAKCGERHIVVGDDEISRDLGVLIKRMMDPDPIQRPTFEHALKSILNILSKIHKPSFEQLKLLFDYYDVLAVYSEEHRDKLQAMENISRLPGQMEPVINELCEELSEVETNLSDPRQLILFFNLAWTISKLLLHRRREDDKEEVKQLAHRIIQEACEKRRLIKTHYMYPELKFKGKTLIKAPPFKDFECFAEIIGWGKKLLESTIGLEKTRDIFEKMDHYTRSAYHYCIARDFHLKGDEENAIKILEKCIELNPQEETFYLMMEIWKEHLEMRRIS